MGKHVLTLLLTARICPGTFLTHRDYCSSGSQPISRLKREVLDSLHPGFLDVSFKSDSRLRNHDHEAVTLHPKGTLLNAPRISHYACHIQMTCIAYLHTYRLLF